MQKLIKRKSPTKAQYASPRGLAARVALVDSTVARTEYPQFRAGDTVRVHTRIQEGEKERIQMFEGLVIRKANRGVGKSFTVRKVSHGVGVERVFLESSPKVAKLEVVSPGKVRRAKLYYIRKLEGKAAKIDRDIAASNASAKATAAAKADKK